MQWLKKYWYYPIFVVFVVGFLWFAAVSTKPADRMLGFMGAGMFTFIACMTGIYRRWTRQELQSCFRTAQVNVGGRSRDCFLFSYSLATKRLFLTFGLVFLPVLAFLFLTMSRIDVRAYLLAVVYPAIMIEALYTMWKKPGIRVLPEGLLIRAALKSMNLAWDKTERLIPWDSIRALDLQVIPVVQTTSNGHTVSTKTIAAAFIRVTEIDPAADAAMLAAGQGVRSIFLPAASIQKEQSFWPFALVGSPLVVAEALQYLWRTPSARADIGTRMGFADIDNRYGERLRENDHDFTKGPLAEMARQSGLVKTK